MEQTELAFLAAVSLAADPTRPAAPVLAALSNVQPTALPNKGGRPKRKHRNKRWERPAFEISVDEFLRQKRARPFA